MVPLASEIDRLECDKVRLRVPGIGLKEAAPEDKSSEVDSDILDDIFPLIQRKI